MKFKPMFLGAIQLKDEVKRVSIAYGNYKDVFFEKGFYNIPRDTCTTHAINLTERASVLYGPIYYLSENKLRTLRDYFIKSKRKG
jgi:hypothetical protein